MRELFYPFSILPPLSQSSKVKLELKDNGGDTWSSTIRGRVVKGNKLFEYKLQILSSMMGELSILTSILRSKYLKLPYPEWIDSIVAESE